MTPGPRPKPNAPIAAVEPVKYGHTIHTASFNSKYMNDAVMREEIEAWMRRNKIGIAGLQEPT